MEYDAMLWDSRLDSTGSPCRACGHAESHNRCDYEDTHSHCQQVAYVEEPCGSHGRNLDKYSKRCAEKGDEVVNGVKMYACWRRPVPCECSWEDREIAALRAQLNAEGDND